MTDERTERRLQDLVGFAAEARYITDHGRAAYVADTPAGALLRNAGERVLIKIATVVERLSEDYRAAHTDVDWAAIMRMRNLVAHHSDKVNHDLMWTALVGRVPSILQALDLPRGESPRESAEAPPLGTEGPSRP